MTVKEFKTKIEKLPADYEIIIQKDSEGNDHSPFYDLWIGAYKAETTWHGEVGLLELTDEDKENRYDKEDVLQDGIPAVFLVPVN